MTENFVFKPSPPAPVDELTMRRRWLRREIAANGWTMHDIITFCVEWHEATGRLLAAGGRPGGPEKFADAEVWRSLLRDLEKKGMLKR